MKMRTIDNRENKKIESDLNIMGSGIFLQFF